MILTVSQIYEVYGALQAIRGMEVPAVGALKLARLARQLKPEVALFDEQRMALIEKHGGVPTDMPGQYTIPDANAPAFTAEFEQMMAAPITLPLQTLTAADLGSAQVPWALLEQMACVFPEMGSEEGK